MASALTRAQLDELRGKLERERDRIRGVLASPASDAPQRDQESELEEAAQRQTERERRGEVEARERALLLEVERALVKLGAGTYGVGEQTGEPIPYERLAAMPWAREPVEG